MLILYRSVKRNTFSHCSYYMNSPNPDMDFFESKYREMNASLFKIPYINPIKPNAEPGHVLSCRRFILYFENCPVVSADLNTVL